MTEIESQQHYFEMPERPTRAWATPLIDLIAGFGSIKEMQALMTAMAEQCPQVGMQQLQHKLNEVYMRNSADNEFTTRALLTIRRLWSMVPYDERNRLGGKDLPRSIWPNDTDWK